MAKYDIILTKTNVKVVKFGSRNHKGDNKLINVIAQFKIILKSVSGINITGKKVLVR